MASGLLLLLTLAAGVWALYASGAANSNAVAMIGSLGSRVLAAVPASVRAWCASWTAASAATAALAAVGFVSLLTGALPFAWAALTHRDQSLRARYGASWAIVTGASSGIGLALVHELARDGLNVVLAAMPDELLARAAAEVAAAHPHVQLRTVPVVLGAPGYLDALGAATADLPITLVFCNAGYMVTGLFEAGAWRAHDANIACNAVAAAGVAHLFLKRMRAARARGAIAFTSSPAGFMPSPFSVLYGATKAMVTHFATSLAGELREEGIDVAVLHPSPVATRFYAGAHAMPTLLAFKSTAVAPADVARTMLRGIGRSVIIDAGYYPAALRALHRLVDPAFLAEVIARVAHTTPDYAVLRDARDAAEAAALVAKGGRAAAAPAAPAPAAAKGRAASRQRR